MLYRKRKEELNMQLLYCQVPPVKIIPKKEAPKGFNYTKPCGAVYGQYDKVVCYKWRERTCEYINYIGDVPDILNMLGISTDL